MNILFVTSVAVVAADPPQSRKLFMDALGLPLEGEGDGDGYYSSGSIPGSKHFGVWPLSQAAQACFGTPQWPAGRVAPQASIEFEVADADAVAAAGGELQRAGFELLHPARTEPWGQTVTRLLTEDGLIVGISYAPRFTAKSLPECQGRALENIMAKSQMRATTAAQDRRGQPVAGQLQDQPERAQCLQAGLAEDRATDTPRSSGQPSRQSQQPQVPLLRWRRA